MSFGSREPRAQDASSGLIPGGWWKRGVDGVARGRNWQGRGSPDSPDCGADVMRKAPLRAG